MKKIIILLLILNILCTVGLCYTDEAEYMWAAPAINRWSNRGIISGYTDGTFKGNDNITRADLTIVANRLNNSIEKNNKRVALDISENDYFFNDVCTAVNKGLIKVDSNKNFRPREYATREDAMVVFANLFNLSYGNNAYEYLTRNFTDGNNVSYDNMNKVAGFIEAGFISGYEDGTLRPKNNITRAELIAMLDNAIKEVYTEGKYNNNIIKGSVVINDENVKITNSEISGRIFVLDGSDNKLPEIINTNIGQGIASRVGDINVVKDSKFETATEYKEDEEFNEAVLGYITYNKTEWTNTDVKVTLKIQGGDYKVVNNDEKNYYRFDNNGEFIFECENDGDIKKFIARVNNIDKVVPVITADISKMEEGLNIAVNVSNDNLSPIEKIAYMPGDVSAEVAIEGTKIYSAVFTVNERGKYTIVAKDAAGNIGRKVISTEDSIYMVAFDPNGGTGTMESQGIIKEIASSLIPNTFTNSAGKFKGWATTPNGEVTYTDRASITLTDNITLYAVWDIHKYPITINSGNNGIVDPSSCTVDYGANVTVTITPDSGYMISDVILNNTTSIKDLLVDGEGNSKTYALENISSVNTINVTFEAKVNEDVSGANKPIIIKGLTPVNWDGEKWIEKDESNWYYNYNSVAEISHDTVLGNGDGAWANAMTEDGSIYVWIPRYSYKIESGEHRENIKSWNSVTDPGSDEDNNKGKIVIKFTDGVEDDYLEDNYKAHPAFTFGDYELSGIWVAKYEASEGNTLDELEVPTKETSVVKFIPNVPSWRDITVSNAFLYSYNTFRDADSHLMKNTEWGAVAYLTNAIGRIPYSNNSYITGNSGSTNTWNTEKGVKASTTHNIYGIYDMAGGAAEYVAAYVDKGSSRNEIINLVRAEGKYKNVYKEEYSNEIFGDAVYEISSDGIGNTSWDYANSNIKNTYGIFSRGGTKNSTNNSIFGFSGGLSGAATEVATFRVVLAIPTLNSTYRVIWKNDDGTILETDTGVKAGTVPVYNGVTPTKPSTEQYTYTFKGWSPEFSPITKNTTYIAQYNSTVNKYTVTWKNYDGTILETDTGVEYGTTPTYDGMEPVRTDTSVHNYVFDGWSPVVSEVTEDITYTAQFSIMANKYTVTWVNHDGAVLETDTDVAYGTTPTYDGTTPTKPSTAQYTYVFNDWSPVISEVIGDVTYTAQFSSAVNKYTITWVNYDGTVLEIDTDVAYGTTPTYDGTTPTKPATSENNYVFNDWNPVVSEVTGDATYTAQFSSEMSKYTVTWVNHDGTVLETDTDVAYGTTPTYDGTTPIKQNTPEYKYTFSDWSPVISKVTRDVTYTAQFSCIVNKYTVTWKNHDGAILETDTGVEYGTTPTYDGITPTKPATAQYTYTFSDWSPVVSEVTGDAIYTAQFNSTINQYTVTWKNYDGTVLETDTDVAYGRIPTYDGTIPTKPATAQYTYVFNDWSPSISEVTGDITYTAQFNSEISKYTVTWVNHDGTVLEKDTDVPYGITPTYDGTTPIKQNTPEYKYTFSDWSPVVSEVTGDVTYTAQFSYIVNKYTVTWKNYDGSILKTNTGLEYGAIPVYNGITPTKPSTVQYTYVFSDWSPVVSEVTGDTIYTAQFNSTINKYTVTWVNHDGSILEIDTGVAYGTTPTYDRTTPTKPATAKYTYVFSDWDPEVSEVTGDVTYTAQFSREISKYTVTWVNHDGTVLEKDMDVEWGTTPTYDGDTPTKPETSKYTYAFNDWDPEVSEVTEDVTYTAQFSRTIREYEITATAGENGTITPNGTNIVNYGDDQTFIVTPDIGYIISDVKVDGTSVKDLLVYDEGRTASYTFNDIKKNHRIKASFEEIKVNTDISGANEPSLIAGLTPVNWNGEEWVVVDNIADWKYNYNSVATSNHSTVEGTGDGAWANAMTADGSLYVWIPRYTYRITQENGYNQTVDSWNADEGTNKVGKVEIIFSNGVNEDTVTSTTGLAKDGYIKHPAFKLGNQELTGIWVAKYEASQGTTTDEVQVPTLETNVAKFVPGVSSWRNISVSKMYDYSYNTFRSADSHLMKNTEWGAVAYLTNAIGRIPYRNNSDNYITGSSAGSQENTDTEKTTSEWNTKGGVKASTTHNVYGIYDMAGKASEYVAAYFNDNYDCLESDTNGTYAGSLYTAANNRLTSGYVDVYGYEIFSSSKPGDAMYETSKDWYCFDDSIYEFYGNETASWDRDSSSMPFRFVPGFSRGGTGIFDFGTSQGNASTAAGFRTVLAIPSVNSTYTITASAGTSGTISPSGVTTVMGGQNQTFTITPNEGYVIDDVRVDGVRSLEPLVASTGNSKTYTLNRITNNHTITVSFEHNRGIPNAPVLIDGLTPVNWNGSDWAKVDNVENWDYNYNSVAQATHSTVAGNGDGKWANAMTEDGSLYVWIPRYTYQITEENGYHQTVNSWNGVDNLGTGKVTIIFSNGLNDIVTSETGLAKDGYIKHPAFKFGDKELTGIWVAKYEASKGKTTSKVSKPTASTNVAKSIPNVESWRSISVSKMYDYAYNTFRNADSHLMKNTEWGAVAYLTNAIGKIPYINNNSKYITGIAGNSQNDSSTTQNTTNNWKTTAGVKASTTHNVYGIYDMSGGAKEYVAAYHTGGNIKYLSQDKSNKTYAGSLYTAANNTSTAKYVDAYSWSYNSSNIGDAVYETSKDGVNNSGWDGNYTYSPYSTYPVLERGGEYMNLNTGIFYFSSSPGGSGSNGFRVVLSIPPKTNTITATAGTGGTISPVGTTTVLSGSSQTFNITPNKGYIISDVIVDGTTSVKDLLVSNEGRTVSYTFNDIKKNYTIKASFEVIKVNTDTSGANAPILTNGLTPVNWDGEEWVVVDNIADWKYNYNSVAISNHSTVEGTGDGAWANAMTADGSLYVWIPRYTYRITQENGYNQTVDSWNADEGTNKVGKVEIIFSNGVNEDTVTSTTGLAKDGYVKHPAFKLGDSELTGIWVAKYEASQGTTTEEVQVPTLETNVAKFVPGVSSWRSISVSKMYYYAYNTFRSADSHLMKNTEWGAVAYLTNAIGRIPYRNNSANYITGSSAGSQENTDTEKTTSEWNTKGGVKASTTHNVYGIYDMAGKASEYVAAYTYGNFPFLESDTNGTYAGSLYTAASNLSTAKYVDIYEYGVYTSSKPGDAMFETSEDYWYYDDSTGEYGNNETASWDGDSSRMACYQGPAFIRGNTGIFDFDWGQGDAYSSYSFRAVLGVPPTTNTITATAGTGGTISPVGTTSVVTGSRQTFNITVNDGYGINDVIIDGTTSVKDSLVTNSDGSKSYTIKGIRNNHTITVNFEAVIVNTDTSGANAPELINGLTPVNWDGEKWVAVNDISDWKYNYNSVATSSHSTIGGTGDGAWANAMTADGSLYVWIPRYTYQITEENGYNQDVDSWNADAGDNKIGKVEIIFSNGTDGDTITSTTGLAKDGYVKHPAFKFGDSELTGIWVAKYEASQGTTTSEVEVPTLETNVAKFVPGVSSWRNISASKMFDFAYNTFRSADSHLMKNTEWGAVAYLTNAIGRIPYRNNSDNYITGSSAGNQENIGTEKTTSEWNTKGGVKASTTHNVYGIYDMAGKASEYVAAYFDGNYMCLEGDTDGTYARSLYEAGNKSQTAKYVEKYGYESFESSIPGDAMFETSKDYYYYDDIMGEFGGNDSVSWDGDSSTMVCYHAPIVSRGNTGIFDFGWAQGDSYSSYSFRAVLAIPAKFTVTWVNYDGTVLEKDTGLEYGTTPSYDGITPTKPSTAQYTYTFSGWSPVVSNVTGDVTYTAQFSSTLNKYTVTWENDDGTVLETDTGVEYGSMPVYNGETPTKAETAQSIFVFNGWSPVVSEVTGDVTYTAQFISTTREYVIVAIAEENGTITPSGWTILNYGANQKFTIKPNEGYVISDVIVDGISVKDSLVASTGTSMTYTFNNVNESHEIKVSFEEAIKVNKDISGANAPVLISGLTPVNWDGEAWKKITDISKWKYNYNSVATSSHSTIEGTGDGAWANAMTADGSLYVWIPRYTYRITQENGYNQTVDSWNADAGTNKVGKVEIIFSNGINGDTVTSTTGLAKDGYVKHPAFKLGDKELTGIWVAKYEASEGSTTNEVEVPTSEVNVAKFIPNVSSWRDISVSKMYDYAYNTFRSADSHLMKNTEWGAVAYLTNAIGRIPYRNNSANYITGSSAGSQENIGTEKTTSEWNTKGGVKASTTHNVYGIYDMSGKASEYVAAYTYGNFTLLETDTDGTYAGSLYTAASNLSTSKYVDIYEYGVYTLSKPGDAMFETSEDYWYYDDSTGEYGNNETAAWDGDSSCMACYQSPTFIRGNTGIFDFNCSLGNASSYSFRAVLAIPAATYTITATAGTGGTISPAGTTSVTLGAKQTFNITPNDGYVISDVIIDGTTSVKSSLVTNSDGSKSYKFSDIRKNHTITVTFEAIIVNEDISGANAPVLINGLTPVNWNGEEWVEVTDIADWKYNYNSVATSNHSTVSGTGDGAWANAMTQDGSLYVWIPRYSYQITEENGYSQDVDSWNAAEGTDKVGKVEIIFSQDTEDTITSSSGFSKDGYIAHPGFNFGVDEEGNPIKLKGFWVAKYESSKGTTTNEIDIPTASDNVAKSIPNVPIWNYQSVSKMYEYAYNTFRSADSHLMKNVEWGAVAYLTNAIGRIPYINNNYPGYTTGNSGDLQDSKNKPTVENEWNTLGGVKASTTHNVYGIYDLSGGGSDYVATYYVGGDEIYLSKDILNKHYSGSLYLAGNNPLTEKYVDKYYSLYSEENIGDAMYETSTAENKSASWDGDASNGISTMRSAIARGGTNTYESRAGIFAFVIPTGQGYSDSTFRVVLAK